METSIFERDGGWGWGWVVMVDELRVWCVVV